MSLPVSRQWRQPVQLVDRAGQRRPGLGQQIRDRRGPVVQRVDGGADRVAVLGDSPTDQLLESVDRAGELARRPCETCRAPCRGCRSAASIDLVVVGQRVGERRRPGQQRLATCRPGPGRSATSAEVSALTSCGFRPWITGFSPPSSRSRSSAGAVRSTGICEPGRQHPGRSGTVDEFEVTVADQVEVADRGLGAGGEHDARVGVERPPAPCVRQQLTRRVTVPTRMPATRTVSPAFSRDASVKTAE